MAWFVQKFQVDEVSAVGVMAFSTGYTEYQEYVGYMAFLFWGKIEGVLPAKIRSPKNWNKGNGYSKEVERQS